jgi:hypothetical protein
MNRAFDEGKALDAAIRYIEWRDAQARGTDVSSPEADGHDIPIDLTCSIGSRTFAFEHTGIEPFADQLLRKAQNAALFDPLIEQLRGRLPEPEQFLLYVPVDASSGLKSSSLESVRRALAAWIEETAPQLSIAQIGRLNADARNVRVSDVSFPVSLYRTAAPHAKLRGLHIGYSVSDDLEEKRVVRIGVACDKKFGKLANWQKRYGTRTVLVLEENDLQLTNHLLVQKAYDDVAMTRVDEPDEVLLVGTSATDYWYVTCLRGPPQAGVSISGPYWSIKSSVLISLTPR